MSDPGNRMNGRRDQQYIVPSLVNVSGSYSDQSKYNKFNNTICGRVKMAKKIGKGRARSMIVGASSIMNKWQDHLLFCWLASVAFIVFTIGCLIIFSPKHTNTLTDNEKCLLRHTHASYKINMSTKINLFLHIIVNSEDNFDIKKYRAVLASAIKNHPGYVIHVYVLFNDLLHYDYKRNSRLTMWETYYKGLFPYNFFDTSSAERDYESGVNYLKLEDNVHIYQATFSKYFNHSPLRQVWRTIPPEIIPLTMRILSIWEHGGISLSWDLFLEKNQYTQRNPESSSRIRNMINELKKNLSTSVIKPRDPFEIKKELIELMKFDLKGASSESYYSSEGINSTEILQTFDLLKKLNMSTIAKFNIDHFKPLFLTPSEQKTVKSKKSLLKLTAGGLRSEAKSYKKLSSSYYSDSYESSVYDPSGEDGLPRSYESVSNEFRLRPQLHPEHVKDEMMRYINGWKMLNSDATTKTRKGRIPLAVSYESMGDMSSSSSESEDEDYIFQRQNDKPIKDPFEDLIDGYLPNPEIQGENIHKVKNMDAIRRIQDELLEYSSEASSSVPESEVEYSSSESSSYMSLEALQRMFGGMSGEKKTFHLYIRESKAYRNNKAFKALNIYTIPHKNDVVLDQSGYYISVRKPCNTFLSDMIDILKNTTDFSDPEEIINQGLTDFCYPSKFTECDGVALLGDEYY